MNYETWNEIQSSSSLMPLDISHLRLLRSREVYFLAFYSSKSSSNIVSLWISETFPGNFINILRSKIIQLNLRYTVILFLHLIIGQQPLVRCKIILLHNKETYLFRKKGVYSFFNFESIYNSIVELVTIRNLKHIFLN